MPESKQSKQLSKSSSTRYVDKEDKVKGGNLAPLISALLLAAVKLGLEENRKKKGERLASSKTRSRSRPQTR